VISEFSHQQVQYGLQSWVDWVRPLWGWPWRSFYRSFCTSLGKLWILAAENTQSALTDMVALDLAVVNGSPTFTTDRGYTANSTSTDYISTAYNLSTATNWKQNSASIFYYCNQSSGAQTNTICGTNSTTNSYDAYPGPLLYARLNNSSQGGFTITNALGSATGSRTASTTTTVYQNGSSLGADSGVGGAPDNATMQILGSSTFGVNTANRSAAYAFGAGLTAAQVSGGGRTTGIDGRVLTFLTAIGGN
jgi:hypothetical protein